jgi:zinc/manganese transport system permease protein
MSLLGHIGAWWAEPFMEFSFMRRALAACFALSLSSAPIGVLLTLRRMSLVGDATAHAVLPGAAAGFVVAGPSMLAMGLGGFVAALTVAVLAGAVARVSILREDASFAAFYLIALATGVLLVSIHGTQVDLMHMLFGTVLAIDTAGLLLVSSIATVTLVVVAMCYRALVADSFDPQSLRMHTRLAAGCHFLFITLVVLNLVAGFQALGTLMAVALMMLPAAAARFWGLNLPTLLTSASVIGATSAFTGLVVSFHWDLPSGPSIALVAGLIYALSALFAPQGVLGSFRQRLYDRTV